MTKWPISRVRGKQLPLWPAISPSATSECRTVNLADYLPPEDVLKMLEISWPCSLYRISGDCRNTDTSQATKTVPQIMASTMVSHIGLLRFG